MDKNHQQERQHDPNHRQQLRYTEAEQQLLQRTEAQEPQQEQQQLILHESSTSRIMEYSPGYRFCPSDEELIMSYLRPKIAGDPLPFNRIPTLDINKHSPETIKKAYKWSVLFKENEMFLFTPRSRKYANGIRPDRTAAKGYWKPTGVEKSITKGGEIVGYRKQLDYYIGTQKGGKRTHWKMHEYRINQNGTAPNKNANGEMNMQLDKCVLCKVYLSTRKKGDGDGDGDGNGEEEDAAESITNADDGGQTVQTNEAFVQNQNNNLVIPGQSIAPAFAWPSTYEPSNIIQMHGENGSFIDQEQAGDSMTNANNRGQAVQTNEALMQNQKINLVSPAISISHAFPWQVEYKPTSSCKMFDQNSSFINQSLRKRSREKHAGDSMIMNANNHGQTVRTNEADMQNLVTPAPSTAPAFAWPESYKPTSDQSSSSFIDQSLQMFDQNSSFVHQSLQKRSCNKQEDAAGSIMNANNYGQSAVQTNECVGQNQNNNLVSMVPSSPQAFAWPMAYNTSSSFQMFEDQKSSFIGQSLQSSFQMFDQNSSLMDLTSGFNNDLFPAMENFPPMNSAAHVEPNYHPFMGASDFNDPCMYMKPIDIGDLHEVDLFDVVKDCKQPSLECPSNSKRQ